MDLVDHERVVPGDVAILEPAPRDAGGDYHHVPAGRLRCGLALAVHHAHAEVGFREDSLRDRSDGERLTRAGARDYPEALPLPRQPANLLTVLALEQRLDMESERELDRLTRCSGGCDDDDASAWGLRGQERLAIGRQITV